jgi:hypothetical protein
MRFTVKFVPALFVALPMFSAQISNGPTSVSYSIEPTIPDNSGGGPTQGPTQGPTPITSTGCILPDDWTFKVNGEPGRGCRWVGNYPYDRCLVSTGAKEACKRTCCGIDIDGACIDTPIGWHDSDGDLFDCDWYAISDNHCKTYGNRLRNMGKVANEACCACGGGMYEYLSPSPSTTTMSPSESPTACFLPDDWTFKVNGEPGRGCGWVGNYPYDRCLVSTGAKEACKRTCCGIDIQL